VTLNTDRVSPYTASKWNCWPIYLSIPSERIKASNIIMCGMYFGKGKPDFNMFLKPLVDDLLRLDSGVRQSSFVLVLITSTAKVGVHFVVILELFMARRLFFRFFYKMVKL